MKIRELLLCELEREANMTCRVLESVPAGRPTWQPHAKSMPLGYLAALIARMPAWIVKMINEDSYDRALLEDSVYPLRPLSTSRELLQALNVSIAEAQEALRDTTEEHLLTSLRLLAHGRMVGEMPRYQMIRDSVFSHLAHHRGQLTVYLRLNEASVPAIYGPSADEARM